MFRNQNNLLNNPEKQRNICLLVGFVAAIFRLGLFVRYPYVASDSGAYDDVYSLQCAASILEGAWLGPYNHTTLIKGVSYPLFVVLANLLCMPYSMLLGVFYIGSAAVFCYALKYLTQNRWALLLAFLYLLFSPIGFDASITQRLYRNAIVFPGVLMVTACLLLVYYKRKEKIPAQLPWLVLSGFFFAFFYYIREDSIWLLPFFVCAPIVTAIWYIWFSGYEKKQILKRCVILVLPIAVFWGSTAAYKAVNEAYYGVNNINDRSGGAFAELTGNMIRIQDESNAGEQFWISRDTLDRITDACPTLAENKDVFLSQYDAWAVHYPQNNGNVMGDLSVWAVREAIDRLGYYSDASAQESFCRKVNEELLAAVEEGRLSFDDAIHFTTQSRGVYLQEIPGLLGNTVRNSWRVLTFRDAQPALQESLGPESLIDFMENIAGVKTIRKPYEVSEVRGWIIVREDSWGDVTLRLRNQVTGEYLTGNVSLYERVDVAAAYPQEDRALISGFAMELDKYIDLEQTELTIFSGDEFLAAASLLNRETESFLLNFDVLSAEIVPDYNGTYSARSVAVGSAVTKLYKVMNPVLLILAFGVYIVRFGSFLKKRSWERFEPVIILSGILLSIVIIVFGVSVFSSWLDVIVSNSVWFYCCGAVPMGQAFVALSLVYPVRSRNKESERIA